MRVAAEDVVRLLEAKERSRRRNRPNAESSPLPTHWQSCSVDGKMR